MPSLLPTQSAQRPLAAVLTTSIMLTAMLALLCPRTAGAAPPESDRSAPQAGRGEGQGAAQQPGDTQESTTLTIEGKVVWLAEALKRRHDVNIVPEAAEYVMALETKQGELYPLVEDVRGRAFRRDKRLRAMQVRLLVRRFPGVPNVQIVRMWNLRPDGLFEVDYWCEICAIAMFELKPCDCCQAPIHLRQRPVDPKTGETAKTGELEESPM